MKSPHGEIVYKEGRVFVPVKNMGHRRIRSGDWVLFKPHVRRSLYYVVRAMKPFARANKHFAGLACDNFKKGEVGRIQSYGPV